MLREERILGNLKKLPLGNIIKEVKEEETLINKILEDEIVKEEIIKYLFRNVINKDHKLLISLYEKYGKEGDE